MKRILITLAAILMAIPAFAQLNVTRKTDNKQIGTVRTGIIRVFQSSSGFAMALTTDNQFDEAQVFFLGADKDSAKATLDDMVALIDEGSEETTEVDTGTGKCLLKVTKQLGVKILSFSFYGAAGTQSMSKGELNKVKAIVEKAK